MSDTGLTVPGMTEPRRRYGVTITVDRDGGHYPNPAEFAVTGQESALARSACIVSACRRHVDTDPGVALGFRQGVNFSRR